MGPSKQSQNSHLKVPEEEKVANGGTNKPFASGKTRGRPKGSVTAKPTATTGTKSRPAKTAD